MPKPIGGWQISDDMLIVSYDDGTQEILTLAEAKKVLIDAEEQSSGLDRGRAAGPHPLDSQAD